MFNFIKKYLGLNSYVSNLDQFLIQFDATHPKQSCSQQAEREKHARIFQQRDHAEIEIRKPSFWDSF